MTEDQSVIEDKTVFREGVILNCKATRPSAGGDSAPRISNLLPQTESLFRKAHIVFRRRRAPFCTARTAFRRPET